MDQEQIVALFQKYLVGDCTEQEIRQLFDAFKKDKNKALFQELIAAHWDEINEGPVDMLYDQEMRKAFANTDLRLHHLTDNDL